MAKMYPMAIVTAPGKIEMIETPLPKMGEGDVKIKVRATTICGSDLHIFKGMHPAAPLPVAVGHEIAGEVIEIGGAVTGVGVGDAVAVEPVINCGECHYCRRGDYHLCVDISFQYRVGQGGFTPFFVADQRYAHKLPPGLSYEEGALIEPLSVAMHAVKKASLQVGQQTAIFGAGAIGLLVLMLARLSGAAAYVADINDFRLDWAKKLGATTIFNNMEVDAVAELVERTGGLGVDVSFEAVGLEVTLLQALQAVKKGGKTMLLGLFERPQVELPANIFVQKEISLWGSQGYNWDFQDSIAILKQGDVDLQQLITHEFSFDQVQAAFDLLMDANNEAIKVVVKSG